MQIQHIFQLGFSFDCNEVRILGAFKMSWKLIKMFAQSFQFGINFLVNAFGLTIDQEFIGILNILLYMRI